MKPCKAIKPVIPGGILLSFLVFSSILSALNASLTAAAQSSNQLSSGTSQRTTVNFSNTFGLYTQLNTTPNVSGSVNAVLNVEPGSTIKSDFGGISNELKQNITVTPTSSSVSIEGMKSVNEYRIAPGTTFSSDMKTLSGSLDVARARRSGFAGHVSFVEIFGIAFSLPPKPGFILSKACCC